MLIADGKEVLTVPAVGAVGAISGIAGMAGNTEIRIEFTRFSAFYSPLIATIAGGFLKDEGLVPKHAVSAPGRSAIAGLVDGSVHVAQSAPSYNFGPLEQKGVPAQAD